MKQVYYCVTSAYHDNGMVTAAITASIEVEESPYNTTRSMRDRDIFCTWYDSKEAADNAVKEARALSSF